MYIRCHYCNRELMSGKIPKSEKVCDDNNWSFICVDCEKHPALCKRISKIKEDLKQEEKENKFLRDNINSLFQRISREHNGKLPDVVSIKVEDLQNIWSGMFPNGHRDFESVKEWAEQLDCALMGFLFACRLFEEKDDPKIWCHLAQHVTWFNKIMKWDSKYAVSAQKYLDEHKEH